MSTQKQEHKSYKVTVEKKFIGYFWDIRVIDGFVVKGLFGSTLTERGAYKRADKKAKKYFKDKYSPRNERTLTVTDYE